jgi:hypothetical protein
MMTAHAFKISFSEVSNEDPTKSLFSAVFSKQQHSVTGIHLSANYFLSKVYLPQGRTSTDWENYRTTGFNILYIQVTVHRDNHRINNQQDASSIQNFIL